MSTWGPVLEPGDSPDYLRSVARLHLNAATANLGAARDMAARQAAGTPGDPDAPYSFLSFALIEGLLGIGAAVLAAQTGSG